MPDKLIFNLLEPSQVSVLYIGLTLGLMYWLIRWRVRYKGNISILHSFAIFAVCIIAFGAIVYLDNIDLSTATTGLFEPKHDINYGLLNKLKHLFF